MDVARQFVLYENSPRAFVAVEMLRAEVEQLTLTDASHGDVDISQLVGPADIAEDNRSERSDWPPEFCATSTSPDLHRIDQRFADLCPSERPFS